MHRGLEDAHRTTAREVRGSNPAVYSPSFSLGMYKKIVLNQMVPSFSLGTYGSVDLEKIVLNQMAPSFFAGHVRKCKNLEKIVLKSDGFDSVRTQRPKWKPAVVAELVRASSSLAFYHTQRSRVRRCRLFFE